LLWYETFCTFFFAGLQFLPTLTPCAAQAMMLYGKAVASEKPSSAAASTSSSPAPNYEAIALEMFGHILRYSCAPGSAELGRPTLEGQMPTAPLNVWLAPPRLCS
jgi:hypothetical protein